MEFLVFLNIKLFKIANLAETKSGIFFVHLSLNFKTKTTMLYGNMTIYVILGITFLLSYLISNRLKSKFEKYSKVPLPYGLSGKEIAERMLRENGISDVRVTCVPGKLTDHYDPINKTVNLSTAVYEGRNVAAAAVSAHECGHAIQHATQYSFLEMRSKLVPIVSFSSNIMQWVLLGGFAIKYFPWLITYRNINVCCYNCF